MLSDRPFWLDTLSRRDFLKFAGKTGLFYTSLPILALERTSSQETPFFQMDLPPGMGLVQIKKGDTLWNLEKVFGVKSGELATLNGIDNPRKQLITGDFLLVPSGVSGVEYTNSTNNTLRRSLILRVTRNPENLLPKDDFTDEELLLLNKTARGVSTLATSLMGPLSMATGFYRAMRTREVSDMSSEKSRLDYLCQDEIISLRISPEVKLTSLFSLEQKRTDYSREKFLADNAVNLLFGLARIKMANLPEIGPFDKGRLSIAVASMAETIFPDNGYVVDGYQIGKPFNYSDFVEYYLIRENGTLFSNLLTDVIVARQKRIKLSDDDIVTELSNLFPQYEKWKEVFDTPLERIKKSSSGKKFVWDEQLQNDLDQGEYIGWWRSILSIRYPNKTEREPGKFGISKFIADPSYEPRRDVDGFLLRRSWELVGFSRYGENPPESADETTVPIGNTDSKMFSYLPDGTKLVSPTKPKSKALGSWV